MVQSPNLEVVKDERPPPDVMATPRCCELLQAITTRLHLPPEVAMQIAFTHTLATLQAHAPLHLQVLVDPVSDHKTELDHA